MKTLLFILALALIATPMAAMAEETPDASTPGYVYPLSVRYELAYQLSKKVCPLMMKVPDAQVGTKFAEVRDRMKLTENELTILINGCLMYVQGGNDTLDEIKGNR